MEGFRRERNEPGLAAFEPARTYRSNRVGSRMGSNPAFSFSSLVPCRSLQLVLFFSEGSARECEGVECGRKELGNGNF